MGKIKEAHRASVVARVTKDRARLVRGSCSKNSGQPPHQPSTGWGRTFRPLCIWGGQWVQRRLLRFVRL